MVLPFQLTFHEACIKKNSIAPISRSVSMVVFFLPMQLFLSLERIEEIVEHLSFL